MTDKIGKLITLGQMEKSKIRRFRALEQHQSTEIPIIITGDLFHRHVVLKEALEEFIEKIAPNHVIKVIVTEDFRKPSDDWKNVIQIEFHRCCGQTFEGGTYSYNFGPKMKREDIKFKRL